MERFVCLVGDTRRRALLACSGREAALTIRWCGTRCSPGFSDQRLISMLAGMAACQDHYQKQQIRSLALHEE
jgi:hypothetical protein